MQNQSAEEKHETLTLWVISTLPYQSERSLSTPCKLPECWLCSHVESAHVTGAFGHCCLPVSCGVSTSTPQSPQRCSSALHPHPPAKNCRKERYDLAQQSSLFGVCFIFKKYWLPFAFIFHNLCGRPSPLLETGSYSVAGLASSFR